MLRDTTRQQTILKLRGATSQHTNLKSTAAKVDTDLPVGLVQRELEMLGIHCQGVFVLALRLQKSTFCQLNTAKSTKLQLVKNSLAAGARRLSWDKKSSIHQLTYFGHPSPRSAMVACKS